MAVTPEEFLGLISRSNIDPQARFSQYTDAGRFLEPPEWTDEIERRFANLETNIDAAIRAQGGTPNVEYNEISAIENPLTRDRLRRELEDIMDFRRVVNTQGTGRLVDAGGRPYYFDQLDPSKRVTNMGVLWGQTSKQYRADQLLPGQVTADALAPSGRFPRLEVLNRTKRQLNGDVSIPDRLATFDIETTGLSPEDNKIWQISIRGSDPDDILDMYFDMDVPGTTAGGPLRDTLLQGQVISPPEDIKKALQMLDRYPALAGHNVSFDLGFIINNLSQNADMMADPEVAELIERLKTRSASDQIWDSAMLARQRLQMQLAPELSELARNRIGRASPNAGENILLQTNLLDLMESRHGLSYEDIYETIEKSLHYADVDTFYEDYLVKELMRSINASPDDIDSLLEYRKEGFNIAGATREQNIALRSMIIQRHAITPYYAMGYDEVSDEVREALRASGDQFIKTVDLGAVGKVSGVALTPVEHAIIQARLQGPLTPSKGDLEIMQSIRGIQAHRAMMQVGQVPTLEDYKAFQDTLGGQGIPFANLSFEERSLSHELMRAASGTNALDETMLRGHFFGLESPEVIGRKTKRAVLPWELLEAAEEAGVFNIASELEYDDAGNVIGPLLPDGSDIAGTGVRRTRLAEGEELVRLSPFDYEREGQIGRVKEVSANFVFASNQDQAAVEVARLKRFLADPETIKAYGLNREMIEQIVAVPFESFSQYGVQVGTMLDHTGGGLAGNRLEVARFHDLLKRLQGGIDVDNANDNTIDLSTTLMKKGEKGNWTSGPTVLNKGLSGETRSKFFDDVRRSVELLKTQGPYRRNPIYTGAVEQAVEGNFWPLQAIDKVDEVYSAMKRNPTSVKATVMASLAGGAYYLYKRRDRRNQYFDEVFDPQPIEPEGFYDQYQAEMGGGMAAQYNRPGVNPMATAATTLQLHDRKIGHNRMGSDKNAHLFGGSY